MKFERTSGLKGSVPRNWIDNTFPNCPLCKQPTLWEYAMEFRFRLNRYHFRCSKCQGILSIPVTSIAPRIGPISFIARKITKKDVRIENIGQSKIDPKLEGQEYPIPTLQAWV